MEGTPDARGAGLPPGPVEAAEPMLRLDVPRGPGRRRWRTPQDPTGRPRVGAAAEAVVAAVAAMLGLPVVGELQRQVLARSEPGFYVAVAASVLAALVAAGMAHRWLGGGRRLHAWAVGLVAAGLAGTAFGDVTMHLGRVDDLLPGLEVLRPATMALAVFGVRLAGVPGRLTGAACGVSLATALLVGLRTGSLLVTAYHPGQEPDPAPPAVSLPEEPAPAAGPAPTEDTASPTLGDLCHPDELELTVTQPGLAGHDVATTLTATNGGERTCRVEAWPSVRLESDGEDLALQVLVSEVDPVDGQHVEADPVVLAPGEAAETQVWWPSWGAAADLDAAQRLRVGVGGGEEVLDLAPRERWDVVRSAEAWVAPWQPAGERDGR